MRSSMARLAAVLLAACFAFTALPAAAQAPPAATKPGNVPELPSDVPKKAAMYAVLMAGQPAGQLAVWEDSAGRHHSFFQFNDRGRGPKLTSISAPGKDGLARLVEISGVNYLKKPVEERFSVESGRANWKNPAEEGSAAAGKAFYVAMNGTPEDDALLARALLANDGKLALLPAGEARITRVGEAEVEAAGKFQRVTQYAISGLDFMPEYIWLDAGHKLFASGGSWLMVIREGWQAAAPRLLAAQEKATNNRAAELARRLTHRPTKPLLIYNANLFDAATATVQPGRTVVIRGAKIESVAPAKPADRERHDMEVIDATGKMLLPGLWDMHVHLGGVDGLLHLAAGVTTVRDLGNDIEENDARIARFDAGTEIGPRVIPAGIIDGRGPYQGPTKVLVSTPEEARAAVDKYYELGYPQIKIYSSVAPELVPVIIAEARKNGQRVSGHVPAGMTAEECVRDGYNEIQHINFIVLNFFPEVKETRTPVRFIVPGERTVELDPQSERVQSFFRLLKEKKVDVDPTLATFESLLTAEPGKVPEGWRAVADRLPAQVRRGLLNGGAAPPEKLARYRASFGRMLELVKAMYDDGIALDAGTDDMAGFTYDRELELLHESGIPAPKVLQIATLEAAKIMSQEGNRGNVEPGKLADLILVNGDPAKNISDIRKVDTVIKGGAIFYPRELYVALGAKPR